jgi:carboxyl-terminal processing protease
LGDPDELRGWIEDGEKMNSKNWVAIIGILGAIVLLTVACSAGFIAGRFLFPGLASENESPLLELPTAITSDTPIQDVGGTPANLEELFQPFWQAWEMVHEYYVDQPVNDEALMRGAINGMLEALGDPHTSYLDPEQFRESNEQLQGQEYEGIGAWVDISGEYLTIISPMPGSPAEEAGLRPGDKVVGVDGEDVTGLDGETVRQRVIGPRGSKVTLTIQREGQENFDVIVERANIVVPTVESKMLDGQIAYIRLYTFGDDTARDLRKAIDDLMKQDPKGMILDLRNNGGGYLETAIDVASEFIPGGVIMYEEYGDGTRETYEARRGGSATEIPLVVLINEGSASASEIVAGAIQDRGRGQLVGETSFGKGSVQTYNALVNDQGAVRVTIARWLTPNQRQINEIGLEPDVKVEITEEDLEAGVDPQLERAIELLTK